MLTAHRRPHLDDGPAQAGAEPLTNRAREREGRHGSHEEATRIERLYEAAIELIGERGYAGTTVDEIVARAGVAKGTVYYHFKGKADLVSALLEDGLQRLAASFSGEMEGAQGPQETLRALVHAELTYIQRYQAFSKLLMSEMWRVDRDWQDGSASCSASEYVSVFAGVSRARASRKGAFRAGLDAQAAGSAIFGMVATAALDWLVFSAAEGRSRRSSRARSMVLGAVGRLTADGARAPGVPNRLRYAGSRRRAGTPTCATRCRPRARPDTSARTRPGRRRARSARCPPRSRSACPSPSGRDAARSCGSGCRSPR